jgi:hypothetical protein
MNVLLHAVSRLLVQAPGQPGGVSSTELADSLADENRLRLATRLALVKLAARCEQADPSEARTPGPCLLGAPVLARRLEALAVVGDDEAIEGLLVLGPELRDLDEALRRERNPLAVLPQALLELLRSRLH